jgi:geranylgeranyl transferase type-2 subunit alpha
MVREALNVGPEDQSLWYYHQFLMLNLTDFVGRYTITPKLSQKERVTYVTREIDDIKELLEDYDDIKWIYEALLEYTLAFIALEERAAEPEERRDMQAWLEKLKALDPKRNGRWTDLEAEQGLDRQFSASST